jgi:hypothetical protein
MRLAMAKKPAKAKLLGKNAKTRKSDPKARAILYKARARWDEGELSDFITEIIGRVVFRDKTISFEWLSDDKEVVQCTELTTLDGISYSGRTYYAHEPGEAKVDATLYSNPRGHLLIGEGVWDDHGRAEAFIVQFFDAKEIDLPD